MKTTAAEKKAAPNVHKRWRKIVCQIVYQIKWFLFQSPLQFTKECAITWGYNYSRKIACWAVGKITIWCWTNARTNSRAECLSFIWPVFQSHVIRFWRTYFIWIVLHTVFRPVWAWPHFHFRSDSAQYHSIYKCTNVYMAQIQLLIHFRVRTACV